MRSTAVCSMIKILKILVEKPKLTDLIHSAIQYCFNIFYQRSKFLFGNAHKILHFQICSTPNFYVGTSFVLVIWKTLGEVSEKVSNNRTSLWVSKVDWMNFKLGNLFYNVCKIFDCFGNFEPAKSLEGSLKVHGAPKETIF